jgi:hypothetical protein
MKNWPRVPDGRRTPRRTGRLIVGRNETSTSTKGTLMSSPCWVCIHTKFARQRLDKHIPGQRTRTQKKFFFVLFFNPIMNNYSA